jgi:hypothetical protein
VGAEDIEACSPPPSSSSSSCPPSSPSSPSQAPRSGTKVCVSGTTRPPPARLPPSRTSPPRGATTKAVTGADPKATRSLASPEPGSRRWTPPSGVATRGPAPPQPGPGPSTSRAAACVGVRRPPCRCPSQSKAAVDGPRRCRAPPLLSGAKERSFRVDHPLLGPLLPGAGGEASSPPPPREEEKAEAGRGPEGKRGVSSETVRFQSSWPDMESTARSRCSTRPSQSNCRRFAFLLGWGEGGAEAEGGEGAGARVGVCRRGSIMWAIFSALGPENRWTTVPASRSIMRASELRAPV